MVHVSDWQGSNAFYRDVLGAELVRAGAGWSYRFGAQQLNLHGPGVDAAPVAGIPVPPGGSDLCFEWSGPIGAAEQHLQRHGIEVEMGLVKRFGTKGAGSSLYFRDPDGSLLEFISYVAPVLDQPDVEDHLEEDS